MTQLRRRLLYILTTCLCVACGGGGSDATPTPTTNPNAYPLALPVAGDWFVYTSSVNPSLPAGSTPSERTVTRNYRIVNADGSFTRADTTSTFNSLASPAFNSAGALVSYTSGTLLCNYAPAYLSGPPITSAVGDSFNSSSTESCATQPNGTPSTTALSVVGNNQAVETKTIPLGSFSAFTYAQTRTATSATAVTTTVETCWIDRTTGRALECTSSYSSIPVGQSTPTSTGTTLFRLEAYSFHGQAAVGAAVRRFAGYWNVNFAGSSIGDCANLLIDINGQISGSCRFLTSAGVYGSPFTVTGSVASNGSTTVTAATGASMSGTFTTPGVANGTWSNGAASGPWNATHI